MNPGRCDPPRRRRALAVAARILATVGAGYVCTAAVVALAALALSIVFGMPRSEAVVLAAMSGFLLYLVVLVWGFAEPRLWRVWAALLGGAVLASALAYRLAPLVPTGS